MYIQAVNNSYNISHKNKFNNKSIKQLVQNESSIKHNSEHVKKLRLYAKKIVNFIVKILDTL